MEKKGIFFDKRDANYIQLHSPVYFYEMFVRKKIKSDIIIPQTVIFTKAIPKLWLFNSSKSKTPQILKKNADKLNPTEIGRVFAKIRNSDEYKIDSLTTLLEILKKNHDTYPVVYLRNPGETRKALNKLELVKALLESKDKAILSLQDYVQNTSNEIYYVSYRQDEQSLPVGYSFFKKSTTVKQIVKLKRDEQSNAFEDGQDDMAQKSQNKYSSENQQVSAIFKFFDSRLNQAFVDICKSLVEFLEKAYRIKVKKMVAKFITDQLQQVYFLGLKELYIEIPKTCRILFNIIAPYDILQMREDLRDSSNCSFENFQILCKMYLRRNTGKKAFKLPSTIYEDEKEISAKLYKNLIVEKCCGDFCEYMMVEKNRGPLAIRKNILDDYKKHFGEKKLNEENFSVTLPYEISFQLILRTRECAEEIIEIMKKNKIYSKNSVYQFIIQKNHHYTLEEFNQDFDANTEYPFKNFKKEVYNMGNLYKNVKICKNCFIVYSLTSKYFDQRLKTDLKNNSWRAQTASQIVTPRIQGTAQTNNALIETSQNSLMDILEEAEDTDKIKAKIGSQRMLRSAQSEQKFKIKKKLEPKLFRLFMPPKSGLSLKPILSQSSQPNLDNTRKQMDVIRLAMGFLNYDQRPKTQQIQRQVYSQQSIRNQKPSQVRKTLHLQENRAIQDYQNEKLDLKKGCNNETQMRQRLKDYYITKSQANNVQFLGLSSIYSYHSNFQHLRNISYNRLSTPAQVLQQGAQQDQIHELRQVCRQSQVPYPPMSIPDNQLDQIQYFSYDEFTAVPYLVMSSSVIKRSPQKEKEDNQLIQGQHQVIIFSGDFFDNCFEYLQIFEEIIEKLDSATIIMLNLPGQAYTVYDDQKTYDNLILCDLLDRLIYSLDQKSIISCRQDNFKFIGIGLGGFIFQTFCCFAVCNIPFISGLLLVNSYAEIDEMLKDTLTKSIEVFQTCPKDMPELAYNYYSVITNSHQLSEDEVKEKISKNPISMSGRLTIIDGCLNSSSALQQFVTLPLQVEVVHSLKTCIVNLSQTDLLIMYQPDASKDSSEKLNVKRTKKQLTERRVQFVDGGHCLIDDNPQLLEKLFLEFLVNL